MANEKWLIDANELKAKAHLTDCIGEDPAVWVSDIDEAPTVDAVEVVRCKDCKQWDEIKHGYGWCCLDKTQHKFAKEEEFCSYGERREGE